MKPSTPPLRPRGLLRWLALLAALLQPAGVVPQLLALGTACGDECCCAAPSEADEAPVASCCSAKPALEAARERAEPADECDCSLRSGGEAPLPERGPAPEDAAGGRADRQLTRDQIVSAHTELVGLARPASAAQAHAPPPADDGAPAGAPGPWKQLARRGLDALLASLGLALL